jgi:hypothetical protein
VGVIHSLKNTFRSALKLLMFPFAATNEYTCQFEFGPDQSVHVYPPSWMPVWICEPTGWILSAHVRDGDDHCGGKCRNAPALAREPDHDLVRRCR